ncbi:8-amino-7-oxononanoate synthase [Brevinematales bacterium NS]|nr:8-amino-7-oxononanoate synthase [Brevinematales bacterium NS]
MFSYDEMFTLHLNSLETKHLRRKLITVDSPQDKFLFFHKKKYLSFGSNSYLGIAQHPQLLKSGRKALQKWGTGSGGSRLITGNYSIHEELERKIASLKGQEDALVFPSGFQTNVSVLNAILNNEWIVFCDRLNHASLLDGIRFSGAKIILYKHIDMNDLEEKAKKFSGQKGIIITDGVFSMDGDIAPLHHIVEIAHKYGFLTMVDDAHGTGILGDDGGGSSSFWCVKGLIDIEMGTFSKAFASEGGFVAARKPIIEYLRHMARGFMFSTALPPHVAAISLKAIEISQKEPWRREKLLTLSQKLRQRLKIRGWKVFDDITPIIPLLLSSPQEALDLASFLREKGIFVPAIRPPAVKQSRLRISLMATHTEEDLDRLVEELDAWKNKSL